MKMYTEKSTSKRVRSVVSSTDSDNTPDHKKYISLHYKNLYANLEFESDSSSDSGSHEDLTTPTISSYFGPKCTPSNINMSEQQPTARAMPWMNLKDDMIQSMKELNYSLAQSMNMMSDDLSKTFDD